MWHDRAILGGIRELISKNIVACLPLAHNHPLQTVTVRNARNLALVGTPEEEVRGA